jgi:hypothetical protein
MGPTIPAPTFGCAAGVAPVHRMLERGVTVALGADSLGDRLGASADVPVLELLVQRGRAEHIDTVLVDGEVVFANGCCTRIDEAGVIRELRARFAQPLKPHEQERRAIVDALRPHVRAFYGSWLGGTSPSNGSRPDLSIHADVWESSKGFATCRFRRGRGCPCP